MSLDDELADYASRRQAPAPTPAEAQALVAHASSGPPWLWLGLGAGLVSIAAMALTIVIIGLSWAPAEVPAPIATLPEETAQPSPSPRQAPPEPRILATGRHSLDADVLTVQGQVIVPPAAAGVVTARLERGQVEVQAAPRAPGESLVIEAGAHRVRVVGTRFTVTREPFTVDVVEGIVQVTGPDLDLRLEAGQRFPRPDPGPRAVVPGLDVLRGAVLRGDPQSAREGLRARLELDPTEAASWELLARLETREGQTEAAADAWRAVIAHGGSSSAQRARFEAALLLLDPQPVEAIGLLQAFLAAEPGALAPEARLHLATAQFNSGDAAAAQTTLRVLIADHPGTSAAAQAHSRLEQGPP